MQTRITRLHRPATVEEAVSLLARPDVPAVPLLLPARPPEGLFPAAEGVDLSGLSLDGVALAEGTIVLGAAATLERILGSAIGHTPAGALIRDACRTTAHSGIRAVASVGGVVSSGDASDLLLALLVLDALCVVRGSVRREVPLAEFSPGTGELLLEVRVPPSPGGAGAALERVARTARDRSIVAAAAALAREGEACARARIALSGLSRGAARFPEAEGILAGGRLTPERIAEAAAAVAAAARPSADHLGSAEYRRAVGAVLARRAITAAWRRAA